MKKFNLKMATTAEGKFVVIVDTFGYGAVYFCDSARLAQKIFNFCEKLYKASSEVECCFFELADIVNENNATIIALMYCDENTADTYVEHFADKRIARKVYNFLCEVNELGIFAMNNSKNE